MNRMKIAVFSFLVFGLVCPINSRRSRGKVIPVKSERKFNTSLGKSELAVVMFYEQDRDMRRDPALNKLQEMFKATSRTPNYKEADVQFLSVNDAREKVNDLDESYGITTFPAFMLFKDGAPLKDERKRNVVLYGFVTRFALKEFINSYFEDDIADILEEKAEARKRRLEEERLRWNYYGPYWGGYGGWWYPYYGGYYGGPYGGYYGSGFGFGFGFH